MKRFLAGVLLGVAIGVAGCLWALWILVGG